MLNWVKQDPATHPPARRQAMMAYDAATGTVVLFGGEESPTAIADVHDTWTWGPN